MLAIGNETGVRAAWASDRRPSRGGRLGCMPPRPIKPGSSVSATYGPARGVTVEVPVPGPARVVATNARRGLDDSMITGPDPSLVAAASLAT